MVRYITKTLIIECYNCRNKSSRAIVSSKQRKGIRIPFITLEYKCPKCGGYTKREFPFDY